MRVASVEVSGFRAFNGSERFDLDGDIVIVVGVNGQGKTSLFDAIHWAITGEICRLGRPDSVVSLYSASGEARVEVTVASDDGRTLAVTRRSDGRENTLLIREGDSEFRGEAAEYELLQRLWPEGLSANDSRAALRSAFERGVYLQQDTLTGFLTADTDQQRFNAIGELVGTGRATELQVALESSRRAWSLATNQRKSDITDTEERLNRVEDQLRDLTGAGPMVAFSPDEWTAWWAQAKSLGVSDSVIPRVESSDAQGAIDTAMAELRTIRLSRERRGNQLRELATALSEVSSTELDLDGLHQAAEESALALTNARITLVEAEGRVAEIRRRQIEVRSEQQELGVLAEVALRHLGEHCPVCQQAYDREATRERLNSMLPNTAHASDPVDIMPDLTQMAEQVQELENATSAAAAARQNAQRQEQMKVEEQERIRLGLAELAINVPDGTSVPSAIESALEENARHLESLSAAGIRGETIALSLARAGQLARRAELEQEVQQVNRDLAIARSELQARLDAGELVSSMIEGLRDASFDIVESELDRLGPLLQRIYSTADPHPEFRVVRLLSRMRQGRGRVLAEVEDPRHGRRIDTPGAFLSSSQMNVLAVSVFLALNLGIPTLPLSVAILDDPLQSVDDLNLLGLVDLLKRIREKRQLMVSTHDSRFASLLERKLRPVSESQRTILVELNGWSSHGPMVTQRDIIRDPVPIRIAAAAA